MHDLSVEISLLSPLKGKTIAFCVGGGIAASQACQAIRALRRLGAKIQVYTTPMSLEFTTLTTLEWASAQPVVTGFSGLANHICQEDAVVVFPTTAHLIAQFALGLGGCVVSTLYQSALGQGKPILLFPSLHESLANINFESHTKKLKDQNIIFIEPLYQEHKWKVRPPQEVALEVSHYMNQRNKDVLITLGGIHAPIDPLRAITNYSTGALGKEMIQGAYSLGFKVNAWVGFLQETQLPYLQNTIYKRISHFKAFQEAFDEIPTVEGFFHLAAVSDYQPKQEESNKVSSQQPLFNLSLVPTEKLIQRKSLKAIPFRMGCKLTYQDPKGLQVALHFLNDLDFNLILWNDKENIKKDKHEAVILFKKDQIKEIPAKSKTQICQIVLDFFIESIRP